MNLKEWREDFDYDIGHKGYIVYNGKYFEGEVVKKLYHENGARKGSTVEFISIRYRNGKTKIARTDRIKLFSKEEIKKMEE